MSEKQQHQLDNSENGSYQGKTLEDRCPPQTSQKKIKNCSCEGCRQHRKQLLTKKEKAEPSTDIREHSRWRKVRMAIVVVLAMAAGSSPDTTSAQKLPPRQEQKTPDLIPTYERSFEVQGVKIQLDDSWQLYEPPEGKSISDLFKEEFERLVLFYKKWNINLSGRTFRFIHDPNIQDMAKAEFLFEPFTRLAGNTRFFDEQNELKPTYFIAKDQSPNPIPIKVRHYKGSTIAHEIFHILLGGHATSDTLWHEGLAEAVERLYEKDHPGSANVSTRHLNSKLESERQFAIRRDEMFENSEVQKRLRNFGWDDTWDLEIDWRTEEEKEGAETGNRSHKISRYLAKYTWQEFILQHPDFLGRLIQRIELDNYWYTKPYDEDKKENDRLIFIGNSGCMRYAAERLYPQEFRSWYRQQNIFDIPTIGEKIFLAYSFGGEGKFMILACKRIARTAQATSNGSETHQHLKTDLVPEPITVYLKNGVVVSYQSKDVYYEIEIPREKINKITDSEGNEILFVN